MRSISGTSATPATIAPTAGAAEGTPAPCAPTWSTSCANRGSSAVAEAKNVAKKSSSMVERISGVWNTKRRPSTAARRWIGRAVRAGCRGGSRIMSRATITARNEKALRAYAHATPKRAGTPAECAAREQPGGHCHTSLGDQHELAAIERVNHHAADQREGDDRQDPHQPHHAARETAMGRRSEKRDVPEDGGVLPHGGRHPGH